MFFLAVLGLLILFWIGSGFEIFMKLVPKNKINVGDYTPPVSIMIPTHNEEKMISYKLRNIFAQDYPKDKMEVIVIDDGSKDDTVKTVKKFKKVKLIQLKSRAGKIAAINEGIKHAKNDIIVQTDGNNLISKNSIRESLKMFSNKEVGGVGIEYIPVVTKDDLFSSGEVYYRIRENRLAALESDFDTCFAYGKFFAFRRSLIPSIDPRSTAEDLDMVLRIRNQGKRVVTAQIAKSYEPMANGLELFFIKIRRIVHTYAPLIYLTKFSNWRFSIILLSHKILPLFTPLYSLAIFLYMLNYPDILTELILIAILLASLLKQFRDKLIYFILMNVAIVLSLKYLFTKGMAWNPARTARGIEIYPKKIIEDCL